MCRNLLSITPHRLHNAPLDGLIGSHGKPPFKHLSVNSESKLKTVIWKWPSFEGWTRLFWRRKRLFNARSTCLKLNTTFFTGLTDLLFFIKIYDGDQVIRLPCGLAVFGIGDVRFFGILVKLQLPLETDKRRRRYIILHRRANDINTRIIIKIVFSFIWRVH